MKPRFITPLEAVKIREAGDVGRARWRLLSDMIYNSKLYTVIVVPSGFVTDMASVPRLPFAYWLMGDTAHASAVVHDYLCKVDYKIGKITWGHAAKVFMEAMKYEGVPMWRRSLMYAGVRLGGIGK